MGNSNLRVVIGADHAGFPLKATLVEELERLGHQASDVGAFSLNALDDYPDFAKSVGERVASKENHRGIIICGSGVGASVAANKIRGVRASVCHDTYSARQGVEHDDMNILCLGSRIVGEDLAKKLIAAFLQAAFTGEERHQRRLDKVLMMDAERDRNNS